MTLLNKVKHLLIDKGMTFTELAEQMGASRSSLYRSLQAESVRYSTLKKLIEILKVDPNKLFYD
jgi:DNA-binding Xre family transcriptional regulator